jgi:molybdopterin molybdotransferase
MTMATQHQHQPGRAAMESVDAYLASILAAVQPLPARELSLTEAAGAVLARDLTATWPLPSFDNSAMDGYAVRAVDVAGATAEHPVTLGVTDAIPAGDTRDLTLAPGSCLRIMTGARLPAGADTIVQVELTDGGTRQVAIHQAVPVGTSVKRTGDDASAGDVLLAAGSRLGPAAIGLLAASGLATAYARPRPRVTVLSTGNELMEPGTPVLPGQIWESNGVMLAAAARQLGCPARRLTLVPDDADSLLSALDEAREGTDVLVTSGGVSMGGEHDVVKAALARLGTVRFTKVAMQPGMPQGFGVVGPDAVPIFTLPGNPVSSFVSFQLFVRPALDALQEHDPKRMPLVRAVLAGPVRSPAGKRSFLRGILDGDTATVLPLSGQASHQLASLARSNALIIVNEDDSQLPEGAAVDVLVLP